MTGDKEMKRIGKSKEPTEKQLESIIENIREKFPGQTILLESIHTYKDNRYFHQYTLFLKDCYPIFKLRWSAFLHEYQNLIGGK